jgi:transposase
LAVASPSLSTYHNGGPQLVQSQGRTSGPEGFLGDFRGYLQADAYSGYDRLYSRGVVEVDSFAHARRGFFDARTTDPERAHGALARIRAIYAVEAAGKDLNEAGRFTLRLERSKPLLERLGTWLEEQARKVLPKSPIGGAIGYARSNWAASNRYLEAGFLAIDNNASERAVKPVALGRNYAGPKIMRSRTIRSSPLRSVLGSRGSLAGGLGSA